MGWGTRQGCPHVSGCNLNCNCTAQVPSDMGPSGGSERKRKVQELFGDIADIEIEDTDSLDMFCKWMVGAYRAQASPLVHGLLQ